MFDTKPPILRAYYASKDKKKSDTKYSDDFVSFDEFRYFLLSLRMYFEYYAAFARVDTDGDKRISKKEFIAGRHQLERWVGPIMDMEAEFDEVDADGGGMVLFDEFCDWAIKKGLDLEDDDDYD